MKKLFRLIIGLALIIFVFRLTENTSFEDQLSKISVSALLLVTLLYFLGQLVSSYKWHLIIKDRNAEASFWQVFTAYFSGMFVNSFGLGVLGGDLARALLISKPGGKDYAIGTVIADRLHGLVVLCFIALTANCFLPDVILPLELCFAGLLCLLLASCFFLYTLKKSVNYNSSNKFLAKLLTALQAFPRNYFTLFKITLISLLFHLIQICIYIYLFSVLLVDISILKIFAGVPFVNIMTSLPISWNGLGVREVSYLYFLTPELTKEIALVTGGIWIIATTINSLFGGIFALTAKSREVSHDIKNNGEKAR